MTTKKNRHMNPSIKQNIFYTGIAFSTVVLNSCKTNSEISNKTNHPNILYISCEDISPYLGCYGDTVAYTPVLDKMAEEGVLFTNCFATMGVCAPARASLITGMYPSSIGANNMRTNRKTLPNGIPPYEATPPPEVRCFTEFLRAAGYYCTNNVKEDYQFNKTMTAWDESSNKAIWRDRPKAMPFFSVFNLMMTHESRIWVNKNDPSIFSPSEVTLPKYYPDDPRVRRDVARMYYNVTIMDRQVGELLDMLKEDGLLEKTIIIFFSDHGGPLPRGKREIYDSGLKVPFLIRFPNKEFAGKVDDDLVSFIDIPATILSLANVKIPDYMQGQAFWGGQKAQPRKYIFAARDRVDGCYDIRRAVRDKHYKYIRNYMPEVGCYQDIQFRVQGLDCMKAMLELRDAGKLNKDQMYWFRTKKEPEELYDITKDPEELHNIADNPENKEVLEKMRAVHEKWMKDIDDKGLMTEKELVWSMWPNGIQLETSNPIINIENDEVSISCNTEGASLGYQINGEGVKGPNNWFVYTKAFKIHKGDKITAMAHRIGYKPSEKVKN